MAKIVRLTESDLTRIVRKVIKEQQTTSPVQTKNQSTGNKLIGRQFAFNNAKTKEKLLGTVEKIYPAPQSGPEAQPGYSQIMLVNFQKKGKIELSFDCKKSVFFSGALNAQVYTEAGVEDYMKSTYCK